MGSAFRFQWSNRVPPLSLADYRELARRAVPKMVWAYIDGGAEDHVTLRANRDGFGRWMLRRRALTGKEATDLSVTVAGTHLAFPVALAPTGLTGLAHWTGELGAAQAAERMGTVAAISTGATYSLEELSAGTEREHWFQLYPWSSGGSDREMTASFMQRARKNGFSTIMVTTDSTVMGHRESELRTGMGIPVILTPGRIAETALHPRWWYRLLRERRTSARILVDAGGFAAAVESVQAQVRMFRPELNWDDLAWMREQWDGPFFVKGLLDADDAERAVDLGADGVVVSNHGGRQLECAPASIDALPAIAARVGERAHVLLDGGIRRGSDVVKALCLGADAVLIGRPYVYGLAARGPAGVEHVLTILRDEMARTMTLMGVGSPSELDRSWLHAAGDPVAPVLAAASETELAP